MFPGDVHAAGNEEFDKVKDLVSDNSVTTRKLFRNANTWALPQNQKLVLTSHPGDDGAYLELESLLQVIHELVSLEGQMRF